MQYHRKVQVRREGLHIATPNGPGTTTARSTWTMKTPKYGEEMVKEPENYGQKPIFDEAAMTDG